MFYSESFLLEGIFLNFVKFNLGNQCLRRDHHLEFSRKIVCLKEIIADVNKFLQLNIHPELYKYSFICSKYNCLVGAFCLPLPLPPFFPPPSLFKPCLLREPPILHSWLLLLLPLLKVVSHPSPHLSIKFLIILGHKPSLW